MRLNWTMAMTLGAMLLPVGALAQAAGERGPPPFVEEFSEKKLDAKVWETGGNASLTLFTVRDGTLRLICEGMMQQAFAATRRADFDFFKTPLSVIWDLDSLGTLAGPYASTDSGRIYAGVAIGDIKTEAPAAELGLTAWPEGFPNPKLDATWYYTLNLGKLMPKEPSEDWRILGVPTRITWTLDATTASVAIEGAKFASGDAGRRSAAHGLKPADFPDGKFRLRLFASPHDKSVEPGVNHIPAVVYTDAIRALSSAEAERFRAASPASKPAASARTTPKTVVVADSRETAGPPQYLFGVNYAGGTFRRTETFIPPTPESLDYYKSKGVLFMRLPFGWEELQPKLQQDLDATYLAALKKTVRMMAERDMKVLLDLHNYARYRKELIGSATVPFDAFADVWKRLASEFKDEPAIWGYGLMNEPYGTNDTWPKMAQAGIDGVRSADKKTMIVVCGDAFSGTSNWKKNGADLPRQLRDPSDNLCYEGHCYFDGSSAGKYNHSYEYEINKGAGIDPMIGVRRLEPFVNWLKENKLKGMIGEFSVPANPDRDERWLPILENVYDYLGRNQIPNTFWAGGTLWTPDRCCVIEPALTGPSKGKDRPQMQILLKYSNKYAVTAAKP